MGVIIHFLVTVTPVIPYICIKFDNRRSDSFGDNNLYTRSLHRHTYGNGRIPKGLREITRGLLRFSRLYQEGLFEDILESKVYDKIQSQQNS